MQNIVNKGPEFVITMIENAKELGEEEKINWVSIANECSSMAGKKFNAVEYDKGKFWALAAVKVYEYLARRSSNEYLAISNEISAIRERIRAINVLDQQANDDLLSIKDIERWFEGSCLIEARYAMGRCE